MIVSCLLYSLANDHLSTYLMHLCVIIAERHCIKPPANYLVSIQVGDLTPGTVAVYNCHDHDLVGPMVVTCLESGRWNHLSYCKETANIHSVITNLHRLEFMNYLASTNVYSNQNLGPGVPLV